MDDCFFKETEKIKSDNAWFSPRWYRYKNQKTKDEEKAQVKQEFTFAKNASMDEQSINQKLASNEKQVNQVQDGTIQNFKHSFSLSNNSNTEIQNFTFR